MKITKSQLKQIIKEELESTLDEGFIDKVAGMLGSMKEKYAEDRIPRMNDKP